MALYKEAAPVASNEIAQHTNGQVLWETAPCATALWNSDRSLCLLNQAARRLIKYSEADFLNHRSLWFERIHPDDQRNFSRAQEALRSGKSPVQCDYRFLPRSSANSIWLREISVLDSEYGKVPWYIHTVYTDISDLKAGTAAGAREDNGMNALRLLSHELMNCVQRVIMEVELVKLGLDGNDRSNDLVTAVDAMNQSVATLGDQLKCLFEGFASQDPSTLVDITMQKLRKELHRQRVNLRLVRRDPVPMVQGDRGQLLSAFERVFEFCGAMLKHGGDLQVEAGPKEVAGQLYAEVKVISFPVMLVDPDDAGKCQSYRNGEGYQLGLGMKLAAEILGRYRGQVSFRKEGDNRGEVTILIKALPN